MPLVEATDRKLSVAVSLQTPLNEIVKCQQLEKTLRLAFLSTVGDVLCTPPGDLRRTKHWRASSWSKLSLTLEAFGKRDVHLEQIVDRYLKCNQVYVSDSRAGGPNSLPDTPPTVEPGKSLLELPLVSALDNPNTKSILAEANFLKVGDILATPAEQVRSLPGLNISMWNELRRNIGTLGFFCRAQKSKDAFQIATEDYFRQGRLVLDDGPFREYEDVNPVARLKLGEDAKRFVADQKLSSIEDLLLCDPLMFAVSRGRRFWPEFRSALLAQNVDRELEKRICHFVSAVEDAEAGPLFDSIKQVLSETLSFTIDEIQERLKDREVDATLREVDDAVFGGIDAGTVFELSDDRFTLCDRLRLPAVKTKALQALALAHLRRSSEVHCHCPDWRPGYDYTKGDFVDFALSRNPNLVRLSPGIYAKNLAGANRPSTPKEPDSGVEQAGDARFVGIFELTEGLEACLERAGVRYLESLFDYTSAKIISDVGITATQWEELRWLLLQEFSPDDGEYDVNSFVSRLDERFDDEGGPAETAMGR